MNKLYLKTITAVTVMGLSSAALAQTAETDLRGVVTNVKTGIEGIPDVIRIICYISGLVFGIAGVMKLKEYIDQPGKTPIIAPLGRLLIGAFLIALPTLLDVILGTTTGKGASLAADKFGIDG